MMTRPRILMLDEPAAGLNPKETEDLKALIGVLRDENNATVRLIDHDLKLVMSLSDHIVVIHQGTPLANGTPEQIRDNPEVIKAYRGDAYNAALRKRFHFLRHDPGPAQRQRRSAPG
jgi:branched-chain amino acid transport system ATP-binding protein